MAFAFKDRVKESTTTTGTVAYALAGYYTGFQPFSVLGDGNTCEYCCTDGVNWEIGLGTYTAAGNTLARTTIYASSNANAAVSWGVGSKDIFLTAPASRLTSFLVSGGALGTPSSGTLTNCTGPASMIPAASSGVSGYMSGTYATKLDGIASGATNVTNTNQLTNGAGYITSSGTAATCTSYSGLSSVYNADWFRLSTAATGLYNSGTAQGIWPASNSNTYGNYTTYGTGANSWQGWGIPAQFTFMGRSGTDCGVHDTGGGWVWYHTYGQATIGLAGGDSASYNAYVTGSLYATGNVLAYSDRRAKKNIKTITGALDMVLRMRGVYYQKKRPTKEEGTGVQIGVIAQEVMEVTPELVTYAPDKDEYGVAYGNYAGLFIESFKDQAKIMMHMQQQINDLRGRLDHHAIG
jgi:hypothetical protein